MNAIARMYLGKSKNPNTRRWEAKGESGSMGGGNANANATATGITLQMQAPPIAIAPEALLHKMTQMQCERTNPKIQSTRRIQKSKHKSNPQIQNPKTERKKEGKRQCKGVRSSGTYGAGALRRWANQNKCMAS